MSTEDRETKGNAPVELPAFDPKPSARFAREILDEIDMPFALIGKVAMWAVLPAQEHELTRGVSYAVPSRALEPLRAALARRDIVPRDLSIGGLAVRHEEIRVDFIDRREGGLSSLFEEAITQAAKEGSVADIGGSTVPVVSKEHLVALKVVAGEDRDEEHAVRLLKALPEIDLRRARAIVAQHGGPGSANRLDALARRAGRPDARPEYRNSG